MYQKLTILGNLGREPELKFSPTGEAVCTLNLATNRQYTDRNGQKIKETLWFRISVWGKQAESCNQYLKKGSLTLVEGRLVADKVTGSPRVYERADGTSGASFEVHAESVRFVNTSGRDGGSRDEEAGTVPVTADDEQIPF